ncbi:MAG: hypothetical protein NTW87_16110 [Planctomycetota bacterium]|nr:hypothetical protein [Planctomycetota bacterium]
MKRQWMKAATVVATVTSLCIGAACAAEETVEALAQKLWPRERIEEALKAVDQQKKDGLLSDSGYEKRRKMLEERLAGKFKPEALSVQSPPLNFIQNGGFEQINRNSAPNRSRWLWWGGWSWGGNYVNMWEDRPDYVHSGKYSARIECKGEKGRIGISTPPLPVIAGAREYKLTFWSRGEGDNELFVNFEEGVTGTLRQKMPSEWKEITVIGKPEGTKKTYTVYFYATGGGTIWLDDVVLVPVGGQIEE